MQVLLFRSDPSPIGLSNLRMSLDIGVGLAALTGRVLVFYENAPVWDGPDPVLARSDSTAARPTILDLFDVPVPTLDERFAVDRLAHGSLHALKWADVAESVFSYPRDLPTDDARFAAFANGRKHSYQLTPAAEAAEFLQVSCRTFGLYSYFFYVGPDDWPRLRRAMTLTKPKAPYRELADDIARSLAPFNALHLRRTDFHLPRTHQVSAKEIVSNLDGVLPYDERLVICSDEAEKSPFFAPIRRRYRNAVFLDEILRGKPWRERFDALPYRRDVVVALVTQLVAARAQKFVGTLGSTFTAMVQRERGFNDPSEPMLFAYDPFPGGTSFAECRLAEVRGGTYTWNRVRVPMAPEALSWFREWPEAFAQSGPTTAHVWHEPKVKAVAPSQKPRRRARLRVEKLGSEILLLDRGGARTIYLNPTAALVWRLCDGSRTVDEITAALRSAYPKAAGLGADVKAAMSELANHGAIELR